jgi:hypothetical protein
MCVQRSQIAAKMHNEIKRTMIRSSQQAFTELARNSLATVKVFGSRKTA